MPDSNAFIDVSSRKDASVSPLKKQKNQEQ